MSDPLPAVKALLDEKIIAMLKCPACAGCRLSQHAFDGSGTGVVRCGDCLMWYPIEEGLLELLVGNLAYREDREHFAREHSGELIRLGLDPQRGLGGEKETDDLQISQQTHFDWYASNDTQSYSEYERTPFWVAADKIAFDTWRSEIQPGKWLMDVGCAQGRSTFKVMDLDIHVIGIDVSKQLVRQALERYRRGEYRAQATFIAADANSLPLVDGSMDYILIYGVLHHLPDPRRTCREVARVLKTGGVYFGSENNQSMFRKIFDLLQKMRPLWYEEAGPEALISKQMLDEAFAGSGVAMQYKTCVFLPPHLFNLMKEKAAYRLLRGFDRIGQSLPILKHNGGLIWIRGEKG